MAVEVDAESLRLYLGLSEINEERAELLLEQAVLLAQSIVMPLPDSASAVILAAAGRAYANPQAISYETVGPISLQRPQAGLYMTKDERRTLRRLAGRGGAFTVDPTPPDADPGVTHPIDDGDFEWALLQAGIDLEGGW